MSKSFFYLPMRFIQRESLSMLNSGWNGAGLPAVQYFGIEYKKGLLYPIFKDPYSLTSNLGSIFFR